MKKSACSNMLANILIVINLVTILIAMILSVVSSSKVYEISALPVLIVTSIAVIVVDIAVLLLAGRFKNELIVDVALWLTVLLAGISLNTIIRGRVTLMGYVYFSDLESGNPVAVSAMRLAIAAWVFYFVGIVANVVNGFLNKPKGV